MDFINSLIKFLTDKSFNPISRIVVIILLFLGVILLNNLIGWHFNYSINQRLNQLKSIEELKRNASTDTIMISYLDDQKNQIIKRKNILDQFLVLFSQRKIDSIPKILTIHEIDSISKLHRSDSILSHPDQSTTNVKTKKKSRSQLWHTLSSSILFIVIYFILLIYAILDKDFNKRYVYGLLIITLVVGVLIWLSQFLLGLIPLINNKPLYNYIINFLVHLGFITILILIFNSLEKKKS